MIRFWLSAPVVALMSALTLLPVWSAFMPTIEGRIAPVTSTPWGIQELDPAADGSVRFYQHFTKRRSCEFLAVNWVDKNTRLRVTVTPTDGYEVTTLAQGEATSGPWQLPVGISLDDLEATTIHRCSPFWITITSVYP